jgi:beta-lactamase class A
MTKIFYFSSLLFLFVSAQTSAQTTYSLKQKIEQIISTKKADVGVSIMGIEDKDTLTINGSRHYPMQSVFKFHIAVVVLAEVDKGNLSLNQKIYIKKTDLTLDTWSPIKAKFPNGVKLTLAEIIRYTVSESDNIGCDILLRLIGGTKIINQYFLNNNFKDLSIQASEEEMHKDWSIQFTNWTTTNSANNLLKAFYDKKLLSKKSNDFLWKTMTETTTGKKRIKGQLPESTIVAHKTGTSGTNEKGISAAVNDIGIVTLANGKHFLISIFVSNSYENEEINEKIISDISKLTWNYFMNKTN